MMCNNRTVRVNSMDKLTNISASKSPHSGVALHSCWTLTPPSGGFFVRLMEERYEKRTGR